ncbi:hypothetical protein KBC55_00600 [Patescibacteria group bacterium]|nr:hypothetical protein [Patescibacteria group bacterium]
MIFTRLGWQKGDVIGLAMVLAVIALIALFFVFAPKAPEVTYAPTEVAGSSLEVMDSSLAATTFTVTAPVPAFVTVHEAVGSAPGPVLGVSELLTASPDSRVIRLDLGETSWPPTKLIALLFADDGDGIFEAGIDLPISADGVVVRVDYSPNTGEEVSPDSL